MPTSVRAVFYTAEDLGFNFIMKSSFRVDSNALDANADGWTNQNLPLHSPQSHQRSDGQ